MTFTVDPQVAAGDVAIRRVALYLHGGGMILGSVAPYDAPIAGTCPRAGCRCRVDYRLAPEHRDPTPIEDVYARLRWLHDHAGPELVPFAT